MTDKRKDTGIEAVGENFSPDDFFGRDGWDSLETRTAIFTPYYQKMVDEGFIAREVRGPHGTKMAVYDAVTKETKDVLMFGSNNYLDLANEPVIVERVIAAIREYGVGIGGPPLLNGTTALHRQLERRLAELKGCEDAILYSSGYAANVGWTSALLAKTDYLVYDALSHASLFDGMKLGDFNAVRFAHNDVDSLRLHLMKIRYEAPHANVMVCVEGVYSMDGDVAPLPALQRTCRKFGAVLCVDDAHGLGVLGKRGHGTHEHFDLDVGDDLVMGTMSKTLASTGGFVAGPHEIITYLRWFSRSHMFSASMGPPLIAQALAGLDFLDEHPERVARLHENTQYMAAELTKRGFQNVSGETAILPILVPPHMPIRQVVNRLHQEGVFVNGIPFPAVPKRLQRLRLSLMATFTKSEIDFAVDKLSLVGEEFGLVV